MRLLPVLLCVLLCSCSSYIYVVRHAEKATPMGSSTDVPLTAAGGQRANALAGRLHNENIKYIYSSNTIRTLATAKPTADYFGITVAKYRNPPDSAFISLLKSKNKNILVVGHSNTVDDIVNKLCGSKLLSDLPDSAHSNLFVVKKKGRRFTFTNLYYGAMGK